MAFDPHTRTGSDTAARVLSRAHTTYIHRKYTYTYIHTHTTSNINASTVFCETFFRRRVEDLADFDEVVHYVQLWLSNQEFFGLRYDGYRHIRNVMVFGPTSLGSKP